MKYHSSNEPSQRQLRVGEQLRHIIAETLRRGHFHDPALLDAGRITVAEVRCSPDLKNATAYVSAIGENVDVFLPALNENAHVFQKDIGRHANLKFTPKVKFIRDKSFDTADNIESILRDLNIPKDE